MQVRLLLGCAGSGKTFRCLSEARQALIAAPNGPPLVLLAPNQGTYQLEQQLLANRDLAGYTRLSIRSFESLARFILATLHKACPPTLTEEGRVMVLRGLLANKRARLNLFRASARLTGFARDLSQVLAELQQAGLHPAGLKSIAERLTRSEALSAKLKDLSFLLSEYLRWLEVHGLQDSEALLRAAAGVLRAAPQNAFRLDVLWIDGFADFSELELDLLCSLLPFCGRALVTFCCETPSRSGDSWLSHWSVARKNLERCRKRFGESANVEIITETLPRMAPQSRFSQNLVLAHLEKYWAEPRPFQPVTATAIQLDLLDERISPPLNQARPNPAVEVPSRVVKTQDLLRLVSCSDREGEVLQASREILAFIRAGGRYREVSVLLRHLEPYYQLIRRIFSGYQIPFFLDRRETVAHHPLAELTRSALRVVAFGWQHDDWFAVLKSGFASADENDIDLLENEALARGWKGHTWHEAIRLHDVPRTVPEREYLERLEKRLEELRLSICPPFQKLEQAIAASHDKPTGPELATALRQLWSDLKVLPLLDRWADEERANVALQSGPSVHQTVWRQINEWLDNAGLAFSSERMALREWLPILDAGLANLTVGVIPPALDQVLVGAVDRSRTPEVKLGLVLGLNEAVFPALSQPGSLLNEGDRTELAKLNVRLGNDSRQLLARERYLGYIACTRPRQKLVLTWAARDPKGAPLNPSSLITRIRQLFPELPIETAPQTVSWTTAQHISELIPAVLSSTPMGSLEDNALGPLLPRLAALGQELRHLHALQLTESISPDLAARLYGPVLRTSVSRLEQFAACPFRFFVHSGLRAEERKRFELDSKQQGTFQHEVLAEFHQSLQADGKRWRDVTTLDARQRIANIARKRIASFQDGLFELDGRTRFTAKVLTESLQDFVETLIAWMRQQYQFDPVQVELAFGEESGVPAWKLALSSDKTLELRGRIDRVDLCGPGPAGNALCVILDYKSSYQQLEPLLVEHGLQLQLLSYLNVLRHWPNPQATFGVERLEPAGVFYVNLRGKYDREANRVNALAQVEEARKLAYRHSGRFDLRALPFLDNRPNVQAGDQFNYRVTKTGQVHRNCKEAVASAEFDALLVQLEEQLKSMGDRIFSGNVEVSPYRKGLTTACDRCDYQSLCRIDPWTHAFRVLRPASQDTLAATSADDDQD